MSTDNGTDRRAFLATALAALAVVPATPQGSQAPEIPNSWADVPSGATLWGLVVFTADEPVEIAVAAGKVIKTLRGRFGGQRMVEYSWRNTSRDTARVAIRARAMAGDRELAPMRVQYLSDQNIYVGFGHRSTPEKLDDRMGGYPYEAVFVGFIVFES
jgi:hypothetical protein